MLKKILNVGFLLFDCFVYRQNVTCLKRFTCMVEEAEDIIRARLASIS